MRDFTSSTLLIASLWPNLRVEAAAAREANRIDDATLQQPENYVMPSSRTCGAMFTANTMSYITEAMGMMLTKGASHPADYDADSDIHSDVKSQALASVDTVVQLIEKGIHPRDVFTIQAFENAITMAYAMGVSTCTCICWLSLAMPP